MVEPRSVILHQPVTVAGVTYRSLKLAVHGLRDFEAADEVERSGGGETACAIALFASMADLPTDVLAELDWQDFQRVAHEANELMKAEAFEHSKTALGVSPTPTRH